MSLRIWLLRCGCLVGDSYGLRMTAATLLHSSGWHGYMWPGTSFQCSSSPILVARDQRERKAAAA